MLILLLTYSLVQSVLSEAGPIQVSVEVRDVATLRSLPPAAVTTVDWTAFIPHS